MSEIKTIIKRAVGFGLAAEVAFIGAGYYFYRRYNSDEGMQEKKLIYFLEINENSIQSITFYQNSGIQFIETILKCVTHSKKCLTHIYRCYRRIFKRKSWTQSPDRRVTLKNNCIDVIQ